MVVFSGIVKAFSHRKSHSPSPSFASQLIFHLKNINSPQQWQLQTTRNLILQPSSQSVKLTRLSNLDSGIWEVSLDRPEARNAIGKDILRGLQHTLEALKRDTSVNVVMVSSSVPNVFCAGADLKEKKSMSPYEVEEFVSALRSTFFDLERLQIPTIAAIEGIALGGGLEMALSCDIRVCGEDAVLGLPETGLAILPGAGGTQRLPRVVGKSIAKELIFTGRKIKGIDAISLGLVNYCVPSGGARDKALEIARSINDNGPLAIRMAKMAIDRGIEVNMKEAQAVEKECFEQLVHTKDRLEGLLSFAEKRKPRYTGE